VAFDRKAYDRDYRLKHLAEINARLRAWRRAHPEASPRQHARYYRTHKREYAEAMRQRYLNDKDYFTRNRAVQRSSVSLGYVRAVLCCRSNLKAQDCPLALVLAMQALIKLRRLINEQTQRHDRVA
jgi:hypothetical protein